MKSTVKRADSVEILANLYQRLQQRRQADPEHSYVARLYQKGEDAVLQKVGEEAVETILAVKSGDSAAIIHETADLWFHCLVMLSQQNITPEQIFDELQRRFES